MTKKQASKKQDVVYVLQIMGSSVLILEPNGVFGAFKVLRVGDKFTSIARPGDLVHFIELPASVVKGVKA